MLPALEVREIPEVWSMDSDAAEVEILYKPSIEFGHMTYTFRVSKLVGSCSIRKRIGLKLRMSQQM